MKLGTFIGQGTLSLSENEINAVVNSVNDAIDKYLYCIPHKVEFTTPNSYDGEKTLWFKVTFDNLMRKDTNGNTYLPKYLRVIVRKEKGYDGAIAGSEKVLDKTSYNSTIDLMGHYRKYRSRIVSHNVGITTTDYQYGTELNDIDFHKAILKIANYIRRSRIPKK